MCRSEEPCRCPSKLSERSAIGGSPGLNASPKAGQSNLSKPLPTFYISLFCSSEQRQHNQPTWDQETQLNSPRTSTIFQKGNINGLLAATRRALSGTLLWSDLKKKLQLIFFFSHVRFCVCAWLRLCVCRANKFIFY